MINWDEELKKIFADPLFADVTAPKKKTTPGDRLIAGFQRIMDFVETHKRLPVNGDDREERTLYNQLEGIRKDPERKERCMPYDTAGILTDTGTTAKDRDKPNGKRAKNTEEQQLADIFNDPIFSDVNASDNGLFDLPDYMKRRQEERREAAIAELRESDVYKRFHSKPAPRPCSADWEAFEQLLDKAYDQFTTRLKRLAPNLSDIEIKACQLTKIGLGANQITHLLNYNSSVLRKRICKKILNREGSVEDLKAFIEKF